jgi:hypothetical protein
VERTFDLSCGLAISAAWDEYLERFKHHADASYDCAEKDFPEEWGVPASSQWTSEDDTRIFERYTPAQFPEGAIRVSISKQQCRVSIGACATSPEDARKLLEEAKGRFPKVDVSEETDSIRATFWAYGSNGPAGYNRSLDSQPWEEVRGNYPAETRKMVDWLSGDDFKPGEGGQLILWHGPPGTGKTTAIRALISEWREWAELHYITDPDKFFGAHSDYMLKVMLEAGDEIVSEDDPDGKKWRILVLEDASELLGASAKAEVGSALQRFLNAVDGMIGQGLRVMVLATTNEEVGKWHEAVTRAGRTIARVPFPELSEVEAIEWAEAHGLEQGPGGPQRLADLYGLLATSKAPALDEERKVGFGF